MYRSWAYILMMVATLAGVVGLLWPSPQVRTIEEIAMPVRNVPRAEPPPKTPKPAAKPAAAAKRQEPAPAPPAVVKRIPAQNTSTKRATPMLENGLQPPTFGKPEGRGAAPGAAPSRPGTPGTRPMPPPRPPAEQPAAR